jgi:hypothetical protein
MPPLPIRSGFSSRVCFFHLPEDRVGIAAGIDHASRAKICGNDGSAAFREQFEASAGFAKGLFAPRAGRPEFIVPAVRTKLVHNASINPRPLKNGFAEAQKSFPLRGQPDVIMIHDKPLT